MKSKILATFLMILISPLSMADKSVHAHSLTRLLVTPENAANTSISVKGYLDKGIQLSLYLTKEHAEIDDLLSSIFVANKISGNTDISRLCSGQYVEVQGGFEFSKSMGGAPTISAPSKITILSGDDRGAVCYSRSQP